MLRIRFHRYFFGFLIGLFALHPSSSEASEPYVLLDLITVQPTQGEGAEWSTYVHSWVVKANTPMNKVLLRAIAEVWPEGTPCRRVKFACRHPTKKSTSIFNYPLFRQRSYQDFRQDIEKWANQQRKTWRGKPRLAFNPELSFVGYNHVFDKTVLKNPPISYLWKKQEIVNYLMDGQAYLWDKMPTYTLEQMDQAIYAWNIGKQNNVQQAAIQWEGQDEGADMDQVASFCSLEDIGITPPRNQSFSPLNPKKRRSLGRGSTLSIVGAATAMTTGGIAAAVSKKTGQKPTPEGK